MSSTSLVLFVSLLLSLTAARVNLAPLSAKVAEANIELKVRGVAGGVDYGERDRPL